MPFTVSTGTGYPATTGVVPHISISSTKAHTADLASPKDVLCGAVQTGCASVRARIIASDVSSVTFTIVRFCLVLCLYFMS